MGFFFVLVVAGLIFWAIKAARNNSRRVADAWSAAASQLGLQFTPGSFTRRKSINGSILGKRVEVESFTRNSGSKSSHIVTRYRIHHPERLVDGLEIKPRGLLSGAAAFFGAQNISTGDADFDSRVVVKGSAANRVAGYLTPARRTEVLRLLDEFKGIKIDDQVLEWTKRGVPKNPAEIVEVVSQLSSAAQVLSGATGDSDGDAIRTAAVAGAAGVVGAAGVAGVATAASAASAAGVPGAARVSRAARAIENIAIPATVAGAAAAILDMAKGKPIPVQASAAIRERERLLAADADFAPAAKPATTPVAARAPEPTAAPGLSAAAPASATAAGEVDMAEACAQLFTRSITSTEAKKRFEERYKGKRVHWSGNLRRASTYSVDIVFKGGPGTKATFGLPVPAEGGLGGSVQAVIQLAPAAAEGLRSRVGEQISFEGRLLSCDTLVRTFNIADASIARGRHE